MGAPAVRRAAVIRPTNSNARFQSRPDSHACRPGTGVPEAPLRECGDVHFIHSVRSRPSLCVLIITTVLTVGCAPVATVPAPKTVEIQEPEKGASLVYLFRPTLDRIGKTVQPKLSVDGVEIGVMSYETYAELRLPAGRHALQLVAEHDADWTGTVDFVTEPDQAYFVALWHQGSDRTHTASAPIYLPPGTGGAIGGALMFLVPRLLAGNLASPPEPPPDVRFESVDREVAEYGMAGLHSILPPKSPDAASAAR